MFTIRDAHPVRQRLRRPGKEVSLVSRFFPYLMLAALLISALLLADATGPF